MKKGTVKFYNESKGYGFIMDNETNQDIFVHASGLNQNVQLRESDEVTFEVQQGKRGLNAVNVEKAQ